MVRRAPSPHARVRRVLPANAREPHAWRRCDGGLPTPTDHGARVRLTSSGEGASLIELLISMGLLMAVLATVLTTAVTYQHRYRGQQLVAEMNQGLRATLELLAQEIEQAGSDGLAPRRLRGATPGGGTLQTLTLDDTSGLFAGQRLAIDTGAQQEVIRIESFGGGTSINAVVTKAHAPHSPVTRIGPFVSGVLETCVGQPGQLQMYGDLRADGTLTFVEYAYDSAARTLTRAETPVLKPGTNVASTGQNPRQVLTRNVLPNPGGTPLFTCRTLTRAGFTFVTEVAVTLTVQMAERDPDTGMRRSQTASITVRPRNAQIAHVLAGLAPAQRDAHLQVQPAGIPIPAS